MNTDAKPAGGPDPARCADIQEVLLAYMTRELGAARANLVREHLRRCPDCSRAAADIQETLTALRAVVPPTAPARLSDEHRRRLRWSIDHPVLDWIHRHHTPVSIVVALIVLAVLALLLRSVSVLRRDEPVGPPVTIGQGPPPVAPEPQP